MNKLENMNLITVSSDTLLSLVKGTSSSSASSDSTISTTV